MPSLVSKRLYTPDDFLRLGSGAKGYELVDGTLEALKTSYLSSYIAGTIHCLLSKCVDARNLGWAFSPGIACRCFPSHPDRVRKPDAAFVALSRLQGNQARTEGFLAVPPDLVVEVISPHDRATRVNRKLNEWLGAGVPVVWMVYPEDREVHVHFAAGGTKVLRAGDTLTGDPVLPGFAVPVADLFKLPA